MTVAARKRGMALFLTLVVTVVLGMFIAGLVSSNRHLFGFTKRSQAQTQTALLAEGALNRLAQQWVSDPAFAGDLTFDDGTSSYEITFDTGNPNFSVNNLTGSGAPTNFRGDPVPPVSADVVVVCRQGSIESRYRYLVRRGYSALEGAGTNGRMIFEDNVVLDSIASLDDPTSVEARFHANDVADSGEGVGWNGSGTFEVLHDVKLTSRTTIDPGVTGSNPGGTLENEPTIPFPTMDVTSQVVSASAAPPPDSVPGGGCFVSGERYLSGNQLFTNDITLSEGSLYVDGDLEIHGGISGTGAIFVNGSVTVRGGNATVITNQPTGAAIIAEGDVTFEGLDAYTFLNNAASSRPTVQSALDDVMVGLNVLNDVIQQPSLGYSRPSSFTSAYNPISSLGTGTWASYPREADFWYAQLKLSRGVISAFDQGSPTEDVPQHIAIPGPTGEYSGWNSGSPLRRLKEALASEYPGDPQAAQVGQALDELAYFFREGWTDSATWDDFGEPEETWSIGRGAFSIAILGPYNQFAPEVSTYWFGERATYTDTVTDFFDYNDPLDLSWIGKANFQGLILSNGDITLENNATVIGSIFADGDLQMRGGATLIYNAEYEELANLATGPVQVYSYEEL